MPRRLRAFALSRALPFIDGTRLAQLLGMAKDRTDEKLTPAEERALKEEASFGKKPGNQTPNTPDVKESEQPYEKGMERHRRVWGQIPGNQTADTPNVNESEHRKR